MSRLPMRVGLGQLSELTDEMCQFMKQTDHVPATVGDSGWHHRGRAHCIGSMQALIQVVNELYPKAA